jgi:hypothetical protein
MMRRTRALMIRALGVAALLVWSSGLPLSANADTFLDDFEGENESSRYPVRHLRHWTIIDSVDLKTERLVPPICHSTGTCIDLVGTTGLTTGGIMSRTSYPLDTYIIGFNIYGSGRDATGSESAGEGVVSRIQVSFGDRSIYANNNIASNFERSIVLRVRGSGKLRFLAGGAVTNIGPLVDNVLIIPLNSVPKP